MQRFTDLRVWQKGHALVLKVYQLSASFPRREIFGITAQLRRAALSVPTNIAEGTKRVSRRDYAHFLNIAEGSIAETQSLVLTSRDLGYLKSALADDLLEDADHVAAMLSSLRTRVLSAAADGQRSTVNGQRSRSPR